MVPQPPQWEQEIRTRHGRLDIRDIGGKKKWVTRMDCCCRESVPQPSEDMSNAWYNDFDGEWIDRQ
jgi:hypothetical protein